MSAVGEQEEFRWLLASGSPSPHRSLNPHGLAECRGSRLRSRWQSTAPIVLGSMPSARRTSWTVTGALMLGTVLVAALCGLLLHHGCTHMPPPLGVHQSPEPGTPRAAYCHATDVHQPWLALGLAALLCATALPIARRFRSAWSAAIALLVCVAFLVAAVAADSLDAALTI